MIAAAATAAAAVLIGRGNGQLARDQQVGGRIGVAGIAHDGDDAIGEQRGLGLRAHVAHDHRFHAQLFHQIGHGLVAGALPGLYQGLLTVGDIFAVLIDGKHVAVTEMAVDLAVVVCNRNLHLQISFSI